MDRVPAKVRLVPTARFHLHLLRRTLRRWTAAAPTWPVTLGPTEVSGHELQLRSPRVHDAAAWRAIRLRDQELIEPWWESSALTWQQRHRPEQWISYVLHARRAARQGTLLPLVVDVDGGFAGQISLDRISPHIGDAEIGIWLDSRLHGRGLATAAVALVADHVLVDLDLLHRLTAPVAVDNAAAAATFRRLGFTPEGTMRSYLDVGGRRRDHDLWALVRPDVATRLGDAARTPR